MPNRIMPASCRSRPVASASAVCCAKIICNGIVGRHATTISSVPKVRIATWEMPLGQEMHARRHRAARDGRDHQPAALAEKRRVRLVVNRRNRFSLCRGHERWKIRKAELVQGSDFRKFKSRFFPRSSAASEIHSSAVCACAMSPGPNTTLGMPPADNTAASQKKSTPSGPRLADAPQKLPDERQFWDSFPAATPARASCWKFSRTIFSRAARRRFPAARRLPSRPATCAGQSVMAQLSGTMFGCAPPEIVPTFTVAAPSSGCLRFRNCAA